MNGDIASLYHLHSSHVRERLLDLSIDDDRWPFRFRTYPGSERIDLPGRDFQFSTTLGKVLRNRRSVRNLQVRPLALARVGRLLHASYGVRGYAKYDRASFHHRPCPSAGACFPLEIYVAAQAVIGLPDGVYHYDARAHQLEIRSRRHAHTELAAIFVGRGGEEIVRQANLVVVITAIFDRTMRKYGERGYRYVWLDAGHLGQNLYLTATALGLGAVGLAGFFDDELNRFLDLPASEEQALYVLCIGHPRASRTP